MGLEIDRWSLFGLHIIRRQLLVGGTKQPDVRKWLELLRLWGWDIPSGELSFGTTAPDEHFSKYFVMKLPSEEFPCTQVFQHWVVKSFLMAEIPLRSLRGLGNVAEFSQFVLPYCAKMLLHGQRGL